MMIRAILYVLPFFIAGILYSVSHKICIICAAVAALFLMFLKRRTSIAFFAILFLVVGFFYSAAYLYAKDKQLNNFNNMSEFEGYITQKYDNQFVLKNYRNDYSMYVYFNKQHNFNIGDYIKLKGTFSQVTPYKKINYYSKKMCGSVKMDNDTYKIIKRYNFITIPLKIKNIIVKGMEQISKDGGSFIAGLVFGYTNDMENSDKENFVNLGIAHILAVSGFNIGIIYYFITRVMSKISAKIRFYVLIISCTFYVLVSGFEPSIVRAYIMILMDIVAKYFGKNTDTINSVGIAAFIMLIFNPINIYNIGFLLSFAAVSGILLFSKEISIKTPKALLKFKDEIGTSIAAFLSTLPIILYNSGYLSLISIIINIIAAPIVSISTIAGFLSACLYLLIRTKYLLYPIVFVGDIIMFMSRIISKIKSNIYLGNPGILFIIIYYFYLIYIFNYIKINFTAKWKCIFKILIAALLTILLFYKTSCLKIHYINVGQGDSIFIETPQKKTILIDTGPSFSDYIAAEQKVIPYIKRCGYNSLDYLIITHFHNDHAGGLDYILNNFNVKKLIAPENNDKLKRQVILVKKNDLITVDNVYFNILAPEEEIDKTEEKNEECLVISLAYKNFKAIFTADAEKSVMDKLWGDYDVYKVQHHGSKDSYSESMMNNSNIGLAVISVGKNNFGHPSQEVLEDLRNRNIDTFRTDIDGNITVTTDGSKYNIQLNK